MDWIAGILDLLGIWKVGSKKKIGFLIFILSEVLWTYIAFKYELYGLLLVVWPAFFINLRNYRKWKREECHAKS